MSSRLRSLDSKISFFAFADIITAVSGVLIFVALLLATDLGLPTDSNVQTANIEQQIQDVLAQQLEVDAQNQRLEGLLTTANTSPDAEKLQADIRRLKAKLLEEQKNQEALLQQLSQSQAAIAKRDAELGLTALKAQIENEKELTKEIESKEAKVRSEIDALDQRVADLQSKLLQLHQREGKLWLIPEKGMTTKEPVLVIASSRGLSMERFGHPEKTRQIEYAAARPQFQDYVRTMKSADEYVVFLIRPSGIALFQDLVKMTRDQNIEVGYDAIEEDKDIYFTPPPVFDETVPANAPSGYNSGSGGYSSGESSDGQPMPEGAGYAGGSSGNSKYGIPSGSTAGSNADGRGGATYASGNGTATTATGNSPGESPFSGTGAGSQSHSSAAGSDVANGKGGRPGDSNFGKSGSRTNSTRNTSAKTNPPIDEVKTEEPKTNGIPVAKPPTPVRKSWWQRFLEWLDSLFQ